MAAERAEVEEERCNGYSCGCMWGCRFELLDFKGSVFNGCVLKALAEVRRLVMLVGAERRLSEVRFKGQVPRVWFQGCGL